MRYASLLLLVGIGWGQEHIKWNGKPITAGGKLTWQIPDEKPQTKPDRWDGGEPRPAISGRIPWPQMGGSGFPDCPIVDGRASGPGIDSPGVCHVPDGYWPPRPLNVEDLERRVYALENEIRERRELLALVKKRAEQEMIEHTSHLLPKHPKKKAAAIAKKNGYQHVTGNLWTDPNPSKSAQPKD